MKTSLEEAVSESLMNDMAYMERDQLRVALRGLPSLWADDVAAVAITGMTIEGRLKCWKRDARDWEWLTS